MVTRYAFTMIELIFAIVIISIAVLSLPMMNQVIAKNTEGSIVQEAIFAASAELNQVLSFNWDENSIEDNTSLSRVIWTSSTDCNNTTKRRPGHINQAYHRRCADDNTTRPSTTMGLDIGESPGNKNDIDDAVHSSVSALEGSSSATGYKVSYNSSVTVTSPSSFGGTSDANIKKITVTISDADGNITQLSTFSSNIGEIDYYKRSY